MDTGYYKAKMGADGLYEIYAVDPVAKQLFFGWASGDARGAWRYGRESKQSRNPDYSTWIWAFTKTEAAELLRDLKSQPPEPSEKNAYKELVSILTKISKGESISRTRAGGRGSKHDPEILEGIPRGVWADHWATKQEEKGKSFSGVDLMDVAPRTPGWAKKWAKEVADDIVKANGRSLRDLYDMVVEAGYPHGPEDFGYHLGMQTAGHGVSWSDDARGLPHDAIKVPHGEFYE